MSRSASCRWGRRLGGRRWACPCHICSGIGLTPVRICTGTGLTPATSAPGPGWPGHGMLKENTAEMCARQETRRPVMDRMRCRAVQRAGVRCMLHGRPGRDAPSPRIGCLARTRAAIRPSSCSSHPINRGPTRNTIPLERNHGVTGMRGMG